MKIKVLCEGQTEEGLRVLLSKAVDIKKCGIHIKTYEGVAQLLRKLEGRVREEIRSGAAVVFCLVDYYHFPLPDEQKNLPLQQRLAAIRNYIVAQIPEAHRTAVRCHIVMHEVEAWILADEQTVAKRLRLAQLSAWPQPETINDMNPPAQVLEQLFRTRSPLKKKYIKAKDGVDLLRKVDCQKVYNKCPTFKSLVDELRSHCQEP